MNSKVLLTCCVLSCFVLVTNAKLPLIYPTVATKMKWIIGFGVPWQDLVVETITSGMVFRFHFSLPASVEQLKRRGPGIQLGRQLAALPKAERYLLDSEQELHGNYTELDPQKHKHVLSSYRWGIYKSLEGVAERIGLNGRDCVLKSICEAAEIPFHFANGMWQELMHILLTPSSSADKLSTHSDNEYYYAENMGRSGANCQQVFKACPRSLLDHFSNLHTFADKLAEFL